MNCIITFHRGVTMYRRIEDCIYLPSTSQQYSGQNPNMPLQALDIYSLLCVYDHSRQLVEPKLTEIIVEPSHIKRKLMEHYIKRVKVAIMAITAYKMIICQHLFREFTWHAQMFSRVMNALSPFVSFSSFPCAFSFPFSFSTLDVHQMTFLHSPVHPQQHHHQMMNQSRHYFLLYLHHSRLLQSLKSLLNNVKIKLILLSIIQLYQNQQNEGRRVSPHTGAPPTNFT